MALLIDTVKVIVSINYHSSYVNFMQLHPSYLLLASSSPRRSELLRRMGLKFQVFPPAIKECDLFDNGPEQMVLKNARLKADSLSNSRFKDALVVGSDTTVVLDGIALGKPLDIPSARKMLQQLSGRHHTVYTAVALRWINGNFIHEFYESSRVHFRDLDLATIDHYFTIVNPLDKAGSYGIQAGRDLIIKSVEGSIENVMGLPTQSLTKIFNQHNFNFAE